MPVFYQKHLRSQLSLTECILLEILISILQSIRKVRLEALATALPIPITFESRRKKLQRFLSLQNLRIEKIWFPIVTIWLETNFSAGNIINVVIDRTNWSRINLLMISVVWERRTFSIYFELLPKLGSSNMTEQKAALSQVFPLFKPYKICVLGDREFCSVKLGTWLREQNVYFCLRLKKNEFVEVEKSIWLELKNLGLSPGTSVFLQGVRVTRTHGFFSFNLAGKWQRKLLGVAPQEGWFILTNLASLELAISAYKKRFSIEEMFRDFKSGGYNLEETGVTGERLITLILLIAIAYTSATIDGQKIKCIGVQKYIGRVKESGRIERRHSSFYIGLYAYTWVNFRESCQELVSELLRLSPNKLKDYQRGQRAIRLILLAS